MKTLMNFIGGEFHAPASGSHFESFNPAIGEAHLLVPDSGAKDVERAVEAAKRAFPGWAETTATERARLLYRIADLIDQRARELAEAESSDQGKPVWLASEMDIPRAAHNFRFFAGALLHHDEQATRIDSSTFNYVARRPVGVAGLISPWNLPLYLLTWKIAPAIAFGNTCVAKPSELTSLTAFMLAEILRDAGLPKGVVNLVFGSGASAGAALVAHPDVPLISFTGGTVTGRAIASVAAPMFKKLSLELGGKNPNVIFDDCDFDRALETTIRSSFLNQGEICLCGSRVYVQKAIYEKFLDRFMARAKEIRVGDPRSRESFMGALVSKDHHAKVMGFLDHAKAENLKIVVGGKRPDLPAPFSKGYFVEPTIVTGAKPDSRLQQEEIFGPVVTVTPFEDETEAIELANGVSYGLSATLWTRSLKRTHAVAERLEAGTVWVNTWMTRDLRVPFGGVKASGVGREGQEGSLDFFTEAKTICVRHS